MVTTTTWAAPMPLTVEAGEGHEVHEISQLPSVPAEGTPTPMLLSSLSATIPTTHWAPEQVPLPPVDVQELHDLAAPTDTDSLFSMLHPSPPASPSPPSSEETEVNVAKNARSPPPCPVVGVPPYTGAHPSLPRPFGRYDPNLTRTTAYVISMRYQLSLATPDIEQEFAAMFDSEDAMFEDNGLSSEDNASTENDDSAYGTDNGDESDGESVVFVTELRSVLSDSSSDEDTDHEKAADADDEKSDIGFVQYKLKAKRRQQQRERAQALRRF
ncbi:hypothetical protein DENSPDRAFT_840638 [Dentipellis sp. KUC8613]|nr:hypothetical protein DENSPDRAFT_840638 [Dentipellis sp. KUC8613]